MPPEATPRPFRPPHSPPFHPHPGANVRCPTNPPNVMPPMFLNTLMSQMHAFKPYCDTAAFRILGGTLAFFGKGVYLSNFHRSPFILRGVEYNCVEQRYQGCKALYVGDIDSFHRIMKASTPGQMKHIGRMVKMPEFSQWEELKQGIMFEALVAKFNQNETLKSLLKSSFPLTLVEASPTDNFWGSGTNLYDPRTYSQEYFGRNLLGIMLMNVRVNQNSAWVISHDF